LLQSIDNSIKLKTVHAHASKIARAEPIVIMYQKKMIFHARQFHKLEMQMTTYEPKSKSPDRMDAMVWAMTELFNISNNSLIPSIFTI
jgi:phage terminase large subunit-like protein